MDRAWCGCLLPSVVVINVFMVSSVPYFYAISEVAAPNCGSSAICDLKFISNKDFCYWCFDFQKLRFISHKIENGDLEFCILDFPDHDEYSDYMSWKGHTKESYESAKLKWGENDLHMPIPPFWELFIEHATAPFFVFQVFSVLLWCFDDYLFYTLLTLGMLVMMESMQVKQRIQNMESLRSMRVESFPVLVYRNKTWQYIQSSHLVPGDIISICSRKPRQGFVSNTETAVTAPCDCLLLEGSCVVNEAVLTGESVPKSKIGLNSILTSENAHTHLDIRTEHNVNKRNMVYGGTKIILHKSDPSFNSASVLSISRPVDHGCLAYVVRTGFYTSQGDMIRTMLYSSARATANNRESFSFIFLLLIFAILSALYVYHVGKTDPRRNHWKLILHCFMIITNVVPPELPLELSYAVNNSLISLMRKGIFCTEPFRIPFAGKVKTCYFDKTGTLTSDKLILLGVLKCDDTGESPNGHFFYSSQIPADSGCVMAACHELVYVNGSLTGNQMELIALKESGWSYSALGVASPPKRIRAEGMKSLTPVFRYGFESANRRMCVVCSVEGSKQLKVLVKGAPEKLREMLRVVPEHYDELYQRFTLQGKRVIALAMRDLPDSITEGMLKSIPRSALESDLTFAGFMLFDCPLKTPTVPTVHELEANRFSVKIITGDNPYTACEIAKKCGIVEEEAKVLVLNEDVKGLYWEEIHQDGCVRKESFLQDKTRLRELQSQFVLCVNGTPLLHHPAILAFLTPFITVFARMSPQQKGDVIRVTKENGEFCLMCGDGTNDVAALKQAHCGVSIMSNAELEEKMAQEEERYTETVQENDEHASLVQKSPVLKIAYKQVGGRRVAVRTHSSSEKQHIDDMNHCVHVALEELRDRLMEESQDTALVKLGDASIASPFTCRSTGIDKVLQILRFGRCTLVTTFQIYVILALNSLINAYSLSVLYIDGVKNGDFQMTISGILIAGLFFFISSSKPLKSLSPERPPVNLFSWYILATIAGQFVIHFGCLYVIRKMTLPFVDFSAEELFPDADFKPNVLNTVIFLLENILQLYVFLVNYQGHPFMQSIRENKLLYYGFIISFSFMFLLSWEIIPPLNRMMDLVPLPNREFKWKMNGLILLDGALSFVVDRVLKWVEKKINEKNLNVCLIVHLIVIYIRHNGLEGIVDLTYNPH
ncbi:putative cation-transporting ATPase [Blastocystis sp. subtype 4]|uniref:putative cation-transporting ATPase n=1 Tax=Blastocystis sp. subtype 4 TaxID=944170 RepID=UPI000711BA61|nr:putative cation-transporting ATPase [Blastocystis sp. subtype 4]KNB45779.1 putative cation-transporting ATPase [Blastocystis sp. subtype 4]|eukprot:XP_014529232.1 putative cation-transporting ATPase [Blastocystis sp. subtype 4]